MIVCKRMIVKKAAEYPVIAGPTTVDIGVHQPKNGHSVVINAKQLIDLQLLRSYLLRCPVDLFENSEFEMSVIDISSTKLITFWILLNFFKFNVSARIDFAESHFVFHRFQIVHINIALLIILLGDCYSPTRVIRNHQRHYHIFSFHMFIYCQVLKMSFEVFESSIGFAEFLLHRRSNNCFLLVIADGPIVWVGAVPPAKIIVIGVLFLVDGSILLVIAKLLIIISLKLMLFLLRSLIIYNQYASFYKV